VANINTFRGLRPKKEFVRHVAVLPYDVVSVEEARKAAGNNRLSFFHISRPEIDFPREIDSGDYRVYLHGKEYLEKMIDEGIMAQDDRPYMYLYTQVINGREQTGLIASVSIDDYLNGVIKRHELTREDKENDRADHIDVVGANTGQVFLFFNDDGSKDHCFQKALQIPPEYDFVSEDDGVRQIIRVIDDDDLMEAFMSAFKREVLYIADGHHRAAAAVRIGMKRRKENPHFTGEEEFNRFMAVIFPHSQLRILSYNRVVEGLNGLSSTAFQERVSDDFHIQKTNKSSPESFHEICMYMDHAWHVLNPRFDPGNDPVNSLDVTLLQDHLLGPVLGILDPRTDKRIEFIGGDNSVACLTAMVDSGRYAAGFSLFPTGIEQLMKVSNAGAIMPPKSTWFVPKLKSGLVMHLI
jgi:uncharacterized protein (DUF1015 family)